MKTVTDAAASALAPDDELAFGLFLNGSWREATVSQPDTGFFQVTAAFDWMVIAGQGATFAAACANLADEVAAAIRDGDFDVAPRQMTEEEMFAAFTAPDFIDRDDFTMDPTDLNPPASFLDTDAGLLLGA